MKTANERGLDLLKELGEHVAKHGEGVRINFVNELKQINPSLQNPLTFIRHDDWFYPENNGTPIVPLPQVGDWDGEADERGLPKDAQLSQQLLEQAKLKAIERWIEKLKNGDYASTGTNSQAQANEPEPEAIDMAALARKAKEAKEQKAEEAGEIIDEKTPEPTPEPVKPSPKPEWKGSTSRVEANLLTALSDFIASTDSPQDDTPAPSDLGDTITKVHDRLDKMEAKQDMLITFMRKAQENFPFLK